MNEHVADDMHACMVHDFNDYENLVICRSLVAQLSGRPQPQGMDLSLIHISEPTRH